MKDYPTGYAETALPLYPKLDDVEFEQFCTDLLNFHPVIHCLRNGKVVERKIVNATKLLSGRKPQKGADIRAVAEEGEVWIFQCKHVQQFTSGEVGKAIKDAEAGWPLADQYVLVTTCGLNTEAVKLFEGRPKWLHWDSSTITTVTQNLRPTENGINLITRHPFGKEWVKRLFVWGDKPLLTWREFFSDDLSLNRRHFHHRTPFISMNAVQQRLETFAREGAGRAMILSGAGGQGKSRLLLELTRQLEQQPHPMRVRFLNLNSRSLSEEQKDFLTREDDLLLIVDDAHRLDRVLDDLAQAASKAKNLRLLIATRPQAVEAIQERLYRHGYAERLDDKPLELPKWKPDEMLALVRNVLNPEHHSCYADRLAGLADRCPLLVILGGALINAGQLPEAVTDETDFRERVFKSFKEDFLRLQPENRRERLDRLMRFLSFVSPAPEEDSLYKKAAGILECSTLDIAGDLELLRAARLVVKNREGIRLYPDLFADAVLLDACLDQDGRASHFYKVVLEHLSVGGFPSLLRNLAQADWNARVRKGSKLSLFDPAWKEFLRRFQEGTWISYDGRSDFKWMSPVQMKNDLRQQPTDRAELLRQWDTFAVYLPERTLELAQLALETAENAADKMAARASVCGALPSLLKPIVIWHPDFAVKALDLLWSLDADEPKSNWRNSSNAITVIADAIGFGVNKPTRRMRVLEWLDSKTREPAAMERLRRQPWVLSALLKPFFKKEVENTWSTGMTIHIQPLRVSVDQTRPIRQKALAIVSRFLDSTDTMLALAVVPVLEEAVHPLWGNSVSAADNEPWCPDRLEVLKVMEQAVQRHCDAPVVLLQLRHVLWNRSESDPDPVVRNECKRVMNQMPDTFELRVVRVMVHYAHHEISVKPGPDYNADFEAATKKWGEFCRAVANEMAEKYPTAKKLCAFIRKQVLELVTARTAPIFAGAWLEPVAAISPDWCDSLLEELLWGQDATLDGYVWPVIAQAAVSLPATYRKTIDLLPDKGRTEQLCCLVNYLGMKHVHRGGLTPFERESILKATRRTEEPVVCALVSVAGIHFANEPQWAIEVLSRLRAVGERSGHEILQSLGLLAETHAPDLDAVKVAECLKNTGGFCFSESRTDEHDLAKIAQAFPKQVYEHFRGLVERRGDGPAVYCLQQDIGFLQLGHIEDADYVNREIRNLWTEVISAKKESYGQAFRLALIGALILTDTTAASARLRQLITECKNGDELRHATEVVVPPVSNSRFVFNYPDIVQLFLKRGGELAVFEKVRRRLLFSVCGGVRGYSGGQLDPECRYILEQAEALANRFRDDALLNGFYRGIVEMEHYDEQLHKQMFQSEDEEG